jgi:thiamine-phosphate pyrophosphorylase
VVPIWLAALGDLAPQLALLLRDPGASRASTRLLPLRAAASEAGIPVLLSCAEAPVALAPEFAGVQLRGDADSAACARARARVGDRWLGCSVHRGSARLAEVDYVCLAPIFPPRTVQPGREKRALGLAELAEAAVTGHRVLALGGMTPATAAACLAVGAHGIAGIGAFFGPLARVADDVVGLAAVLRATPADVPPPRGG